MRTALLNTPLSLVRLGIRRPKSTIGLWISILLAFASTVANLTLDTSTSAFLDQSGAPWRIYEESLSEYGGDEFIVVALEGPAPFDPDTLNAVSTLSEKIRMLSGVRRVDSLSTVPLIRSGDDGRLLLSSGLEDGLPTGKERLAKFISNVRNDRIAPQSLVSKDEKTFAINVLLNQNVGGDRTQVVAELTRTIASENASASGVPIFRTAVNSKTYNEVMLFVPLTLLCVTLVVSAAFSSIFPVIVPLSVGTIGSIVVIGLMSVFGVPLSLSTMILPSILLALGCAYSMHLLTSARGAPDVAALGLRLEAVAKPIALSGLTTAIGFFAMATARIEAIEQLAYLGAAGVVAITICCLNLGPAVIVLRPISNARGILDSMIELRLRQRVTLSADKHRKRSLVVWTVLLAVMTTGALSIRISTDIIVWFPHGSEIRDDYERIRSRLSGISPVNVVLRSEQGRAATTPEVLRSIHSLTEWLNTQNEVGKSIAVTDPLIQLHETMTDGEEIGLPPSEELVDQYLLVLEGVEYMQDVLSEDRLGANVVLRVNDNGSDRLVALGARIKSWWSKNGASDFSVETTGLMYEFGRSEERIAHGQVLGLSFALISIGAILLIILRAPMNALVALLPNAVPLVVAFGTMGFLSIPLDAATVCLGSLALGIAVDDTIHLITSYTDRRAYGDPPPVALDRSLQRVLPALVYTTAAIAAGFAVLAFSEFTLIRNLGIVTSGLVSLCLIADLTLLPPLLLSIDQEPNE